MAGRDRTRRSGSRTPDERALYIISVAAELAGVHPQTLRTYERKGLIQPKRTSGNTRRYSERDIAYVRLIQELTQERGMNLAGVEMVMELTRELDEMRERMRAVDRRTRDLQRRMLQEMERSRKTALVPLRTIKPFPFGDARKG